MSKLEIKIENAIKAYNAGCPDTKKVLINLFGEEIFKPKDITAEIKNIDDVYSKLNCNPKKDTIIIDGFDEDQIAVVKAVVKKMRVCEAYNGRKKLLISDRRYYNWYVKNSSGSGLAFINSSYYVGNAHTSSASRLSFSKQDHLDDARTKFPELDLDIIDLR